MLIPIHLILFLPFSGVALVGYFSTSPFQKKIPHLISQKSAFFLPFNWVGSDDIKKNKKDGNKMALTLRIIKWIHIDARKSSDPIIILILQDLTSRKNDGSYGMECMERGIWKSWNSEMAPARLCHKYEVETGYMKNKFPDSKKSWAILKKQTLGQSVGKWFGECSSQSTGEERFLLWLLLQCVFFFFGKRYNT